MVLFGRVSRRVGLSSLFCTTTKGTVLVIVDAVFLDLVAILFVTLARVVVKLTLIWSEIDSSGGRRRLNFSGLESSRLARLLLLG